MRIPSLRFRNRHAVGEAKAVVGIPGARGQRVVTTENGANVKGVVFRCWTVAFPEIEALMLVAFRNEFARIVRPERRQCERSI